MSSEQPPPSRGAVLKNSAAILGARIVIPLAFFALSLAVARALGPEGLGQFALIMSFYTIFSLLSGVGLENLIIREVSKEPEKSGAYFSHVLVLGALSSLSCALLMTATAYFLGYEADIRNQLLWLTLVFLPGFVNIAADLVFIALHKSGYAFLLSLIREGSMLGLSIFWLLKGSGLRAIILALVLSRVLGSVLAFFLLHRSGVEISRRFQPAFFRRLVALVPSFLVITLLSSILLEIDIIILSTFAPASEVGAYMAAKKLVRASFLLIFSAVTALFPGISRSFHQSIPGFEKLFRSLWRRMLLASTALATVVFLLAEWAVYLTYGPRFSEAVGLMRTLTWMLIPLSLSFLLSRFLIIGNQQNKDLEALAISVPFLIVTGIAGATLWGTHGMAAAMLLSLGLLASIHYRQAQIYLFEPGRSD